MKMGQSVVILGTQWGDEGKGKIVDLLTDKAQYVIRYQGGHNAGHTLVINGEEVKVNVRAIQRHPVRYKLVHLDFVRV